MVFNMAFLLTDGVLVGHGIGGGGLAAINLIAPIMMLINGMGMMLGMGASVVAAIHLSKGNVKAARINVTQAFEAGIAISLLIGAVGYLFPGAVLGLLGVEGSLYAPTLEYYLWFLPTCLLLMVQTLGLFVIRLDGSPKYAMYANIIPAIVNGVLDYVFIYPCHWGLMGAALATDIGGLIGTLMVLYYMAFKTKTLHLYRLKATMTSLRLGLRNVGYMVRVGAPGLVGEVAVAIMMAAGNRAQRDGYLKTIEENGFEDPAELYWKNEWGARDLDLHAKTISGESVGWNTSYYNNGEDVIFSGDMTDADPEASEVMWFKKRPTNAIVSVLEYHGNSDYSYDIFVAQEKATNFEKNYMVDPRHIIYKARMNFKGATDVTLGYFRDGRFVFHSCNVGNGRIPNDWRTKILNHLTQCSYLTIREVLQLAGIPEDPDSEIKIKSKGDLINFFTS